MSKQHKKEKRKCRICGCTDDKACPGGCYWVGRDLCSKCEEIISLKKAIKLLKASVFCDSQGKARLFKNRVNRPHLYHLKIHETGYNNALNELEKLLSEKEGRKSYPVRINHEQG